MISSLRGTVLHLESDAAIVEVGGVGFSVAIPAQLARQLHVGETAQLHTNLIVREDALSLFGFETREELTVFGLLLGVTGIGPKSALGVLSSLTVGQIAEAVANDDDAPFRRVSGIGPKTAKLLVVQLAGKMTAPRETLAAAPDAGGAIAAQVVAALAGLGWSERIATEAVTTVSDDASAAEKATVSALLRLTLAYLGPARKESVGG